ncbi:diguanylate cyclase [Eubacteriaceae bacterium ES3]|nr:diguanylate cyclase [Eubacteriaceae bacterium ES3]
MKNRYRKNKTIIAMGIIISVIWLSLSGFLNQIYENRTQEYLDHQSEMFTNGIESLISTYSSYADFIFQSMLNTPDIRAIISEAKDADAETKAFLRAELSQKLAENYKILQDHNFRHLQFHLSDGESFLRLHKPENYGDNLLSVRESIRQITVYHQFVAGFEEGRASNGYRYIYPLFDGVDYIGSVEVSLSPGTVIEGLYNMTENQGFGYLLRKDIMKNVDFSEEQDHYRDSLTSDLYVVDLDVYQVMINQTGIPALFFENNFVREVKKGVEDDLASGDSFVYTFLYQDSYYLVQYNQIRDISGQKMGYFFSISEDDQIENLIRARDISLVLVSTIYFMLLLVIYYVSLRDKEIIQVAMYDQLTEIFNRRAFFELANIEVAKAKRNDQPMSLAIFDIDHFKHVNDHFGHHVGDQVLRELAQIVKASIRGSDILARHGGEEFIVLMPETDLKAGFQVMERLRCEISDHIFEIAGKITISIGLVEKTLEESLNAAIIRGDSAMYTAKKNGRNRTEVLEE